MINERPVIANFIKEENLAAQEIYRAKRDYVPVFVNKKLYEKIFKEKFNENSWQKLSKLFSLTLDKNMSNGEILACGFADVQKDASGISLGGNLGSGRAFFCGRNFNIKGEKTTLAKAKDIYYSDGKFCLQAAIKESVLSNVLADDFAITNFKTLAVFDKGGKYIFRQQYQDEDDNVCDEFYPLKEAIEIRYYENGEFYRISNKIADNIEFNEKDFVLLCKNIGKMEANKFIDRFLHGAWSSGNLTTQSNMLDFDTCSFVEGRHPQFSNTNKYKSNYFGYEILGQKLMMKNMIEYSPNLVGGYDYKSAEKIIDRSYNKHLKKGFCQLLGIDDTVFFKKNKSEIEALFNKFITLSRKFLPNYNELNVNSNYVNNTYIYNFSRFFAKYLIKKRQNNDFMTALSLLVNSTININYEKLGFMKEFVEENFKELVSVDDEQMSLNVFEEVREIINLVEKIYQQCSEKELEKIKFNCYVRNYDRHYLYNNNNVFDNLYLCYERGLFDNKDLDLILNSVIEANKRVVKNNLQYSAKLGLKICKEFLYYFDVCKDEIKIIFKPFHTLSPSFAKVFINGKDYYLSHEENYLISQSIKPKRFVDVDELDVQFQVNGNMLKCEAFEDFL